MKNIKRTPLVTYLPFSRKQMDLLTKAFGIEGTDDNEQNIPNEDANICPLPPPTGKLYYCEFKNHKIESNEKN